MNKGYVLIGISFLGSFLVACGKRQVPIEEIEESSLSAREIDNEISSLNDTSSFNKYVIDTPSYTITDIPPIDDPIEYLNFYFGEDRTTRFFYDEERIEESEYIKSIRDQILYDYGYPTTTLGDYYPLIRTGNWEEKINQFSMFTNDPTRDIQTLTSKEINKDIVTYRCYFCEEDGDHLNYNGEDATNIFVDLSSSFAIEKSSLPNYIPLQYIGIQTIYGLLGYSEGYLVLFPFKFPVDHKTFKTVQVKEQLQFGEDITIPSLSEIAGEWRQPRFQNAGILYDKYLGDDKDWVYFRTKENNSIRVARLLKAEDFTLSPVINN